MSQATQGQHLRLTIGGAFTSRPFVMYSTDLSFHVSSSLENSTTKDTTDSTGEWIEQEKTKYNVDGSVTAILAEAEAQDLTSLAQTGPFNWELDWVNGAENRVFVSMVCCGSQNADGTGGLFLSNVEISAPRDGFATITANFVIAGGILFTAPA